MYKSILPGLILLSIVLLVIGIMVYHPTDTVQVASTFSLTPTPSPSPATTPDPEVLTWANYNNDTYNFRIDYPTGWNQQEYKGTYGAFLIAFSPNTLPCKDCTYVHDGYFSVKVYTATTDPQAYTNYTTRVKNAGKDPHIRAVHLNGSSGVLSESSLAIENNGYVYEVTLDNNNGKDTFENSKIFQKTASSLTFTNLVFTN